MATAATPVTTQVWTREVDPEIHEKLGYMAGIWLLIDIYFLDYFTKFRHIFYIYFRFYKVNKSHKKDLKHIKN